MVKRSAVFTIMQQRFRSRRFRKIDVILRKIISKKGHALVLDAGGTGTYWNMLATDIRPKISVIILNLRSELDLYKDTIDGLSVQYLEGNACYMPEFSDEYFDLVHSNSVIEHVGSYRNMISFAEEVRRVGRAYYVQTPNFWFPIDPHYGRFFVHWFPDPIRIALFQVMSVGQAKKANFAEAMKRGDDTKIISSGMMRKLFGDGRLEKERFLLMTKSITAIRSFPEKQ